MSVATPAFAPRPGYRAIRLYAPDRRPAEVDLSDNTNRWGAPPAALAALAGATETAVTRYPPLYAPELKERLAAYAGATPDMVVTGCGSDDVLDSAFRAFAEPGNVVAASDPTFAMVPLFARMNGLEARAVPLDADCEIDVDGLLEGAPRIVYVCAPNNPTGTAVGPLRLRALLARAPGVVIVDEAYGEFAGTSAVPLIAEFERLLVVRTMSKAFGLAGLRIGYALGRPDVVAEVEKSRGPYKVSAVAEAAAIAALGDGLDWVRNRVADAVAVRERLQTALAAIGRPALPSQANFVLIPVPRAGQVALTMRARGVAVRPFEGLSPVTPALAATGGSAIRLTIGPWPMVQRAVDALAEADQ